MRQDQELMGSMHIRGRSEIGLCPGDVGLNEGDWGLYQVDF